MPEIKEKIEQLQLLQSQRDSLTESIEALAMDIVGTCPHNEEDILETIYRSKYLGGYEPPFRVCKNCGLAEEETGTGYKILKPKEIPPKIPRESLAKIWRVGYWRNGGIAVYA